MAAGRQNNSFSRKRYSNETETRVYRNQSDHRSDYRRNGFVDREQSCFKQQSDQLQSRNREDAVSSKKRKFSPVVWDHVEKQVKTSSNSTVIARSSSKDLGKFNQIVTDVEIQVSSVESTLTNVSDGSPLVEQEAENEDGEYIVERNLSKSKWAFHDSPRRELDGNSSSPESGEFKRDGSEGNAASSLSDEDVEDEKYEFGDARVGSDGMDYSGSESDPKRIQGSQSRNNGSYDRNSLPSGWLDCPPYGDAVKFIIPSKVPLGESFNDRIVIDKQYSPQHAIRQQRRLGRELGLVIDLTNTNRYYRESDWTREGIKHVKIRCTGRDSVPDNESVERFIQEVTQFSAQHARSNKYVLVHCTHGHNRTGYMIVHFLIRSESVSLTEAINRFSKARPPGIYKQDYIDDLCNFFGEQLPRTYVCPQTPEWKRSPDRDDDVASGFQGNDFQANQMTNDLGEGDMTNIVGAGEMPNAVGEDEMENVLVPREMTSDDILGEPVPFNKMESMRQFCNDVLKLNSRGRGKPQFPGSHPVSLSRDNLQLLRQRYYYATWKADGTRYMMLITREGCYLIDRNFNFRSVYLRFPCGNANEGAAGNTHNYTLLDGEMVVDTDPSTHKQERRYLIYDLIAINKVSLVDHPFSSRWKILENEVIKPRNRERDTLFKSRNPYYRYDLELFRVRRKDFYLLSAVSKLLKEFIPRLSHASDGLIFQGWDDPYVPRTHEGLLKWKYPEMNSVDFLLEVGSNNRPMLCLNERGKRKLMDGSRVAFRDPSVDIFSLSGKIIECSWDSEENVWVFMRMRPDKSTPNEFITFKKVMRSIKDNITEEVVLNEIHDIVRLPMYADRIKTDCKTFEKNGRRKQ